MRCEHAALIDLALIGTGGDWEVLGTGLCKVLLCRDPCLDSSYSDSPIPCTEFCGDPSQTKNPTEPPPDLPLLCDSVLDRGSGAFIPSTGFCEET